MSLLKAYYPDHTEYKCFAKTLPCKYCGTLCGHNDVARYVGYVEALQVVCKTCWKRVEDGNAGVV